MRAASPELIAFLNSGHSFRMVDLYDFQLQGGDTEYYSGGDFSLEFEGNFYRHDSVIIEREGTRTVIGTEVDTLDMQVTAHPDNLLEGSSWISAVRNGALDGAVVLVRRLFMPTWDDTTLGAIIVFSGLMADINTDRMKASVTCHSDLQYLNIKVPRDLYQTGCKNTLYKPGCTLTKADWRVPLKVISATRTQVFTTPFQTASYFDLGTMEIVSGIAGGASRTVKSYAAGVFSLALPLITPPSPGDDIDAYPGCPKTRVVCRGTFNNERNYRGEPFVPVPETGT